MQTQDYDLFIFAGQSNMAGRAAINSAFPEKAPNVNSHAGYEFRAISDPTKLYLIQEPFGVYENNPNGINEPTQKTGSLVSSFVNAYFYTCQKPMIAISASKGGSSILEWLPGTPYYLDLIKRLKICIAYMNSHNMTYKHIYLVWCQGETDGKNKMDGSTYIDHFNDLLKNLFVEGVSHCFLIQIGHFNAHYADPLSPLQDYTEIIMAQKKLALNNPNITIVSTKFESMLQKNMMKDTYHYYQAAYNEVGLDAGINTGIWVNHHYD